MLTDFEKNKLVLSLHFEDGIPSSIAFSLLGELLVIGFTNGLLKLFLLFTLQDKTSKEQRPIPILELLHSIADYKVAVLSIKFAPSEDAFAVSFESPSLPGENSSIIDKELSFIAIFRAR